MSLPPDTLYQEFQKVYKNTKAFVFEDFLTWLNAEGAPPCKRCIINGHAAICTIVENRYICGACLQAKARCSRYNDYKTFFLQARFNLTEEQYKGLAERVEQEMISQAEVKAAKKVTKAAATKAATTKVAATKAAPKPRRRKREVNEQETVVQPVSHGMATRGAAASKLATPVTDAPVKRRGRKRARIDTDEDDEYVEFPSITIPKGGKATVDAWEAKQLPDFEDLDENADNSLASSPAPESITHYEPLRRSSFAQSHRKSSPPVPSPSQRQSHTTVDEDFQTEIQRLRSECAEMESIHREAVDSVAHVHNQLRSVCSSIQLLRKQNQSLEIALQKMTQEKNDVQAIVLSHRSTEQAVEKLWEVGPSRVPVPTMSIFLVQELGYWVDINTVLSDTATNPDGSVMLPSGRIDIALEKSQERIHFIQRWMAAMLPSLGTAMDTELLNAISMDPMEHLQAILEAVSAAKTQLQQERDTQNSMAREADERRKAAMDQLRLLQEQEERVAAESAQLLEKKQRLMELVNVSSTPTPPQSSTRRTSRRPALFSSKSPGPRTPTHHHGGMNPLLTPLGPHSRPPKLNEEVMPPRTSSSPSRPTQLLPSPTPPLP
ncbi:hypothetical protein EYR40_009899 [Pleurotus pulmonarius]|nr:hypothetical protein EYR40_004749 [Pleurotus pulmonarius]KAF4580240.1 hypothetical protein EYR40_004750 [Pleurotus pulmonarius]KAF4591296.1 hypothetical protein EYR40_009899 [Pleurotus pulmonarius]